MRVALTGASGFVGGAIARRLVASGHEVLALGRAPVDPAPGRQPADPVVFRWDLGSGEPAPAEVRSCDIVVHAAAHVAAWGDERAFQRVTVEGTARLLDAVDPAARLVVIGSSSVYAPDGRSGTYAETDGPVAAGRYLGSYARAKADQERLVAARRPDAIVLRPRAVWGPGDRTLLPRLARRIRAGRLILPDGGRHPMSTTHVDSLVDAVEAAIASAAVAGSVNVADATPHATAELLLTLFAACGRPLRIVAMPSPLVAALARATEATWRWARIGREPPLTRYAIDQLRAPMLLDLSRLHAELGIRPDADVAQRARDLAAAEGFGAPGGPPGGAPTR